MGTLLLQPEEEAFPTTLGCGGTMVETMDLGIGARISLNLTSQFLCLPDLEMLTFLYLLHSLSFYPGDA